MSNPNTFRGLLGAALLGLVAYGPSAEATALPPPPSSCSELKAFGAKMGRSYVLFLESNLRKPYVAFCDFSGGTYLTLPGGTDRNFSQYVNVDGHTVQTSWQRVRFDPDTMKIDTWDFRFTQSTGFIPSWNTGQIPFGTAGDCDAPYSSLGRANVDLTGLPFKVTALWSHHGASPAGSATKSSNDQIVDVTGGGYCGNTSSQDDFTLDYVSPW